MLYIDNDMGDLTAAEYRHAHAKHVRRMGIAAMMLALVEAAGTVFAIRGARR